MNIQELHRQAMEFADQAFCASLDGNQAQARVAWRQAFELERKAALLLEDDKAAEPTRSVLLRSAASLALDCGETLEARRLIEKALSGNPPDAIVSELQALFQQVNSQLAAIGASAEIR